VIAGNVAKFEDLASCIDHTKSQVLNASNPHVLKAVLGGEGVDAVLHSDSDEQILIEISFLQPVKVNSISIVAPAPAAPQTVKLFANRVNLSFDDMDSITPTQTLELNEGHATGTSVPLQFVKFQTVNSMTVFIENNVEDAEVTSLQRFSLVGTASQKTNMNDLKKCG
jgi:hypothetical protein